MTAMERFKELKIVPVDFDFDAVFTGADLFHVSGITPVLSGSCTEITRKAILTAKTHGVTIILGS